MAEVSQFEGSPSSKVQHNLLVLYFHAVGADAEFWVVEGLAGFDVELPLVPGAFDDFALAGVGHAGRAVGQDKGAQAADAKRAGLVRADVAEGVVVAAEIENTDLPPIDGHDLAAAGAGSHRRLRLRARASVDTVQFGRSVVHHVSAQLLIESAHEAARLLPIPVGIVAGEYQHLVGVEPVEEGVERLAVGRVGEGLGAEADVLAQVFAGQPLDPRRVVAQALPVGVHVPHQTGHPENVKLDEEEFEVGELFEDAFADQAGGMGHRDLRAGHAHLQIVGGVAGRGGRRGEAGALAAEVDAHGQSVALAGFVDGVIDAIAERMQAAGGHQYLGYAGVIAEAVDLGRGLLGVGGRNVNGSAQTVVLGHPLIQRPIVVGAAVGGSVIDGGIHGHTVWPAGAGEDGHVDAVVVQMLLATDFRDGCRVGLPLSALPQVLAGVASRHVCIGQAGSHQAEIFDLFHILARQVGEENLYVGRFVMHVAVDNALSSAGLIGRAFLSGLFRLRPQARRLRCQFVPSPRSPSSAPFHAFPASSQRRQGCWPVLVRGGEGASPKGAPSKDSLPSR